MWGPHNAYRVRVSGWHAATPTCAKAWTAWRCWPSRCWQEDPFSGALFAFRGKRGGLIKLLWFDGQGLCLFSKRLEKGHFVWPVNRHRPRLADPGAVLDVAGRHRLAHAAARPASGTGGLMPLLTQI